MDVLKIVVGSSAYWCDIFIHVNTLVKNTMDMLPEIGRSKNINHLFSICIPLIIPMYINIIYYQQIAIVGSSSNNSSILFTISNYDNNNEIWKLKYINITYIKCRNCGINIATCCLPTSRYNWYYYQNTRNMKQINLTMRSNGFMLS